jgi:hypothetical protein
MSTKSTPPPPIRVAFHPPGNVNTHSSHIWAVKERNMSSWNKTAWKRIYSSSAPADLWIVFSLPPPSQVINGTWTSDYGHSRYRTSGNGWHFNTMQILSRTTWQCISSFMTSWQNNGQYDQSLGLRVLSCASFIFLWGTSRNMYRLHHFHKTAVMGNSE